MLLKNVHVDNHEEVVDVRILNGKFSEIKANLTPMTVKKLLTVKKIYFYHHLLILMFT